MKNKLILINIFEYNFILKMKLKKEDLHLPNIPPSTTSL